MNGLYIHLPFCLKKCLYCDFVSYSDCFSKAPDYIDALICEMKEYRGEKLDTVYFGGGTPTSLPEELLIKLICAVFENFEVEKNAEITVECNPKTAGLSYFKNLKNAGVNRLSIGTQSLNDSELKTLGRVHSAEDAEKCILDAQKAGFENINADLMFGLGTQTKESVLASLDGLISLKIPHISCYSLIIEENTPFGKMEREGMLKLMDEDTERDIYASISKTLIKNGYNHYEISNYAKAGFLSHHNTKYWKRAPYIGLGAASHSFYQNKRYQNPDEIYEYIDFVKNKGRRTKEIVSLEDAISEFMFLGLRILSGISKSEFKKEFGICLKDIFQKEINELTALNLLEEKGDFLRLTPRGIDVSNEVFIRFLT